MGKSFKVRHDRAILFHEREIWIATVGANREDKQNELSQNFFGPVVIIQKFNPQFFWGILVIKIKKKYCFQFYPPVAEPYTTLSKLRFLDSKRLHYKVGMMNKEDFYFLKRQLKQST